MPQKFTDEELMAYADGELSPKQAANISNAAKSDPKIAARIEMFRGTSQHLKQAFPPLLHAEKDRDLAAMIRGLEQGRSAPKPAVADNVVSFKPREKKPVQKPWWQQAAAAAAVLLVVLAGSYLLSTPGPSPTSPEAAGLFARLPDVEKSLQTQLSATIVKTPHGDLAMIASFKDKRGGLCREFELTAPDGHKTTSVACRTGSDWQVVMATVLPKSDDVFTPAGGAQAVEAYLQSSGMTEPLAADEEKTLLQLN